MTCDYAGAYRMKQHMRDYLFLYFLFLVTCSVMGSSHVGINGENIWRQSDVYAHILGFSGHKGMAPLHDFAGVKTIYDIPIYEYIVARLAQLVDTDVLIAARYVNLVSWIVLAVSGAHIAERLFAGSRVFFWMLAATSPLFLHYFATPLPDVMATSLSAAAVALLLDERFNNLRGTLAAVLLLIIAALIKSPVPFAFVVFYAFTALLNRPSTVDGILSRRNLAVYAISAIAAVSAELIRRQFLGTNVGGFAQDPSWYFGTLSMRLSADFWLTILRRLVHDYSHPLLVLFIILATIFFIDKKGRAGFRQVAPGYIAFATGWLTFANVFTEHNYYQIPVTALLFISASIVLAHAVQELEPRVSQLSTRLGGVPLRHAVILFMAAVAPILMIYGYQLSNYRAPNFFESAKYLLRDSRHLLWVGDEDVGPIPGGMTATPFTRIPAAEFEANCDRLVAENTAIIVKGESACLGRYRHQATSFINDSRFLIYIRNNP